MGKGEKAGLGRALLKHHNHMIEESREKGLLYRNHNKKVLESVTDVNDIDAVIQQADEAHRFFSDNHPPVNLLVNLDSSSTSGEMTVEEQREQQRIEEDLHASSLRVPRRPPWNSQMSVEDLNANEGQAFLVWRRSLARLEKNEKLVLTPFEKNLDIWRQLWRVVERSDLIVMVVDARDPLFYRCPDLEAYVKEVDQHKKTLLLVNKADLLPNSVREKWAEYFRLHGILFLFWSAKAATAVLEGKSTSSSCDQLESTNPDTRIYGREELLACLQSEAEGIVAIRNQSRPSGSTSEYSAGNSSSKTVMVGFVGYPNVGKSSTINALVGEKRTGVTSTPGKTKHFQTLIISDKLTLCDCPGLVFPSFTSSRFEMIASGVLPIHRMTEHREPVQVVANRVPRQVIEQVYNISLPKPKSYEVQSRPPLASEFLKAYCASRGYVASSGLPDETKAARQILKDYIDGKLPHFELPPEMPLSDEVEDTGTIMADEVEDIVTMVADEVEDNGTIVADEEDGTTVLANEVADTRTILSDEDESDSSDAENSPVIELDSGPQLEDVLEELNSFDMANGLSSIHRRVKKATTAPHKQHKKPQRKKDRTWRVKNSEDDGMPAVRVFQKPLNTGPLRL